MSFSLKPKEGGSVAAPPPTPPNTNLLKGGILACLVLIAIIGFSSYSARTALDQRVSTLEQQLIDQTNALKTVRAQASGMASDLEVVTKRAGVTASDLDAARKFAEKLKSEQAAALATQ